MNMPTTLAETQSLTDEQKEEVMKQAKRNLAKTIATHVVIKVGVAVALHYVTVAIIKKIDENRSNSDNTNE